MLALRHQNGQPTYNPNQRQLCCDWHCAVLANVHLHISTSLASRQLKHNYPENSSSSKVAIDKVTSLAQTDASS